MNLYKATLHTIIFFFFFNSANALDAGVNLALDDNSSSETAGDFNHDGQQDFAVRDAYHHTVTVYLGNGNGGFRKAGKLANGTNPPHFLMADLNADGKLDLISTHSGSGGLLISLGLGHGKFKSSANYLEGVKPLTVNAGDFNGDNRLDIAAINLDQNAGFLLYGDNNANFTVQETDLMSSELFSPLATGKLTSDNQDDPANTNVTDKAELTRDAKSDAFSPGQISQSGTTAKVLITKAAPTTAALEQSVLQKINAYRVAKKLPPLTLNATISNLARTHSQNMASGKVPFGHQGFQTRVQTIAKSFTFRAAAENVAMNQGFSDPAATAVNGWLNSAGHRNNIVGNYNLTGLGVAKNSSGSYYFTQIFWRR
jgi:uncharacterized protein YkwD